MVDLNTYKVFLQKKKEVSVQEGTTVLEAERIAGLSPDAPCGVPENVENVP